MLSWTSACFELRPRAFLLQPCANLLANALATDPVDGLCVRLGPFVIQISRSPLDHAGALYRFRSFQYGADRSSICVHLIDNEILCGKCRLPTLFDTGPLGSSWLQFHVRARLIDATIGLKDMFPSNDPYRTLGYVGATDLRLCVLRMNGRPCG